MGPAMLLVAAFAAAGALAQQPPAAFQNKSADQATAEVLPPTQPLVLTGTQPAFNAKAALRQRAAHRFLAQRGISWESRAAAPTRYTGVEHPAGDAAPVERLRLARAQQRTLLRAAAANPDASSTPQWQSLGPAQVSTAAYGAVTGRITSLAADPNDSTGNTLYLGSTGGGVWKSTNAAGSAPTFVALTDLLPAFSNASAVSLSIGALTVQPTSSSVILAGTGDINDALDSYYGVGILRSTDGGSSWTRIPGSLDARNHNALANYDFTGNGFAGFAWSSTTPNLVVAAVAQSAEGMLVNAGTTSAMLAGLYYSSDAGQTWYLGVIEDQSGQIVQSPTQSGSPPGNSATSVVWNPIRHRFYAAVRFHGYYESLDGITWMRLVNQPGSGLSTSACPTDPGATGRTSCPIFRGVIAAQPVTGDLFALTTDLNNLDQGLFHDLCSTSGAAVSTCASPTVAFSQQIASGALEAGGGDTSIPEADYNLTLSAVSSQQDTILFAGTEDILRCSLANSCAWRNTTNIQSCAAAMVAPSQHATEATFGSTGLLYFGNDGGLWRVNDPTGAGQTGSVCAPSDSSYFKNLNGGIGSLAEIEHFSVSPGSASTVLAGMGGFGTVETSSGTGAWQQLLTGEGSYTAIDPNSPQNWYTEAGSGVDIHRCTSGTSCDASGFGATAVIGRPQVEGDADYFLEAAPWILDPLDSANLLLGTCRVWRGPATGGWSSANLLSPLLDGDQQPFCNGNAQLRSIAAGASTVSGSEQVYTGMAGPYDGGGTVPGHVYTSTAPQASGLTSWADLYGSPVTNAASSNYQFNPGGFAASSIAVDPHDPTGQTVYVTMQGFAGNGISGGILYGSTDGGAHWLNLTNSLPSAPANSVVIDPNVASTLYLALDTGVYYTTNIASCSNPLSNCWAVYGAGLPNAPVTELKIYNGGARSILEAATYGRGIWSLGLATAPATGTLTPGSYTFTPGQQVLSTSAAAPFTLHNTGSSPMSISQFATTGDYAETNNCGPTLASNASCTIQVTFTPTVTGDRPGTLTVTANVSGGQLASTLDGTGLAAGTLSVSPVSLSFPSTVVGATTTAESLTLQNTGGSPVQLQTPVIAGDYKLSSDNCGATLAAAASCTLAITFSPVAAGDRPGTLSIPSSLAGSPLVVPLDGSGLAPAALTLSPTSLAFGSIAVGATSAAQGITVTSSGGAPVQLQTPTVTGDYQIASTTCGAALASGSACLIQIVFTPTATGSRAGLLSIASNVAGSPSTALLGGTGVAPAALRLQPSSLTFPATKQGVTSAALSIKVTSTGGATVQMQTPTLTGDFAISADSCGATLAPGGNCVLSVTFTPTAAGDRPGLLTIPANIVGGQAQATLDGNGLGLPALTLNPASLIFGNTAQGATSAAQSILVTNSGGTPALLTSIAASGDFAVSTSSCGASLAAGANCTVQITFTPTATGSRTGLLSIAANIANSPATALLSGTGVAPASVGFSPSPAAFGSIVQGTAASPMSITATNTGSISVQLQTPSITGDYQISGNGCGAALGAGATCAIQVIFHPTGTGLRSGTLTLPGSMAGGQVVDALGGTGLAPGLLTLTPASLLYASLVVNSTSPAQTVTVANQGGVSVTLQPATITGDYRIAGNSCGATLAAGSTCTVQVSFHPVVAGDRPGQLLMPDQASGGQLVVTLDGTGLAAGLVAFAPASASYGSIALGGSSPPLPFVATNSGGVLVNLQPATITGDYSLGPDSCGTTLAPGKSCTVQVIFTPSALGTRTGTLALSSDAPASPTTASLTGIGLAPGTVSFSPALVSFGSEQEGSTSAAKTVVATNGGGVAVQLGALAVSGDYELGHTTCTSTLAAGASCTIQIFFAPAAAGTLAGTLSLPGQFSASPATVSLTGVGVAPGALTLSPASLTYGSIVVGQTSSSQTITVTASGAPVQLGTPAASGDYRIAANTCGASLAVAASCSLQVIFAPTAAGARSGLLTVPGNIAGGEVTAAFNGTGVAPGALSLSPASSTFPATGVGASSPPQPLTLQNTGGAALTLQSPVLSSDYVLASTNCGATLVAAASCLLQVGFRPTATGDRPGTISVNGGTGTGQQAQATLDGTGVGPVHLALSPGTLSFGSIAQGGSSAPQSMTLANSGGTTAQLQLPRVTGDYVIASNACGSTLAANAQCAMQVTFSPTASGSRPGSLTISTTDGTSVATVALGGTGTALTLTPASLNFGSVAVGSTLAGIPDFVVANFGSATVQLQTAITGETSDFVLSTDTCTAAPLANQHSCTLVVSFQPTAAGARTALLTVSDGAETHSATLSGNGLSAATDKLSTTTLSFATQVVGTVSAAQGVTLTNSGGTTLGLIATQVTGPFVASNNCGSQLGGNLSCAIAVSYAPTAAGTETGSLVVTDSLRSQTVTLSGSGALPPTAIASPTSLDFGNYAVGVVSPVQLVTLNNNGTAALTNLTQTSAGADFAIASNTCGGTLAPGASCSLNVSFTPQQAGNRTGQLTFSSPSLNGSLTVALSGAGEDFALSVSGSSNDVITNGQTASYHVVITPVGASSGTLAFACSGAPANSVCTLNPTSLSVAGGATGSLTVTIQTGVAAASRQQALRRLLAGSGGAFALLLPFLFLRGSARRTFALLLFAVALTLLPTACGVHASGGSASTPPGGGGPGTTPTGTYTVTITGSFPGAQRTVAVTLVVQ